MTFVYCTRIYVYIFIFVLALEQLALIFSSRLLKPMFDPTLAVHALGLLCHVHCSVGVCVVECISKILCWNPLKGRAGNNFFAGFKLPQSRGSHHFTHPPLIPRSDQGNFGCQSREAGCSDLQLWFGGVISYHRHRNTLLTVVFPLIPILTNFRSTSYALAPLTQRQQTANPKIEKAKRNLDATNKCECGANKRKKADNNTHLYLYRC